MLNHLAIIAHELDRQRARTGELEIGGAILVTIGVAADDDGLRPTRHQTRHILANDRLAENHATQNIADGAIWRLPHFLQVEFLHPLLIRRDGGAFHTHTMLLDGIGTVDRHLIARGIAVFNRQIVIFEGNIKIGVDQLVLDELPDDARHLITVQLHNRIRHLDFRHDSLRVLNVALQ